MSEVWDPGHSHQRRDRRVGVEPARHLHVIETPAELAGPSGRLELGAGDFDIAAPDLTLYEGGEA